MVTFLRVPLGAALLHPDRHATKVCGLAGRGGKAAPTSNAASQAMPQARRFFTQIRHATKVCGLAGRGGKAAPTSNAASQAMPQARRFFTQIRHATKVCGL